MTNAERVAIGRDVYHVVTDAVESLEASDNVGPDLAYLLGAILCDVACEWPTDRPIVGILRDAFSSHHPVWAHVTIEP